MLNTRNPERTVNTKCAFSLKTCSCWCSLSECQECASFFFCLWNISCNWATLYNGNRLLSKLAVWVAAPYDELLPHPAETLRRKWVHGKLSFKSCASREISVRRRRSMLVPKPDYSFNLHYMLEFSDFPDRHMYLRTRLCYVTSWIG